MKKKDNKHVVTFAATPQEIAMFKRIMHAHRRRTYSDVIRFLLETENEKILFTNATIEAKVVY